MEALFRSKVNRERIRSHLSTDIARVTSFVDHETVVVGVVVIVVVKSKNAVIGEI